MIRPARLSDVAEIARIHVDAWRGVFARAGGDGFPESPSFDQRLVLWQHVLGGGPRRTQVWVALDPLGNVLAFAGAGAARVLRADFDGELTAIYVDPPAQGRGLGRALLSEVLTRLGERGFRTVMAWVPEHGGAAGFCRKAGAATLPERRNTALGTATLSEIAMAWNTGELSKDSTAAGSPPRPSP